MFPRALSFVLFALLLVSISPPSPALADPSFVLATNRSVDTPTRFVDFQGDTYEVSSIARAAPGDVLRVETSVPESGIYRVLIYNADRQIVDSERAIDTADAVFEFPLRGYSPGSYMLVLTYDGVYQAVQPLVVEGYRLTLTAPRVISAEERLSVIVSLNDTVLSQPPASVQVTLATPDRTIRRTASRERAGVYTATVSPNGLPAGEYSIYATAHAENTVFGEKELLGVSNSTTLHVEKRVNETSPVPSHSPSSATPPSVSRTTTTRAGSNVITPAGTTTSHRTRTPGQSGFSALLVLGSILLLLILRSS